MIVLNKNNSQQKEDMVTGVTTEWDDIQVKMGVYKPLEKGPTND